MTGDYHDMLMEMPKIQRRKCGPPYILVVQGIIDTSITSLEGGKGESGWRDQTRSGAKDGYRASARASDAVPWSVEDAAQRLKERDSFSNLLAQINFSERRRRLGINDGRGSADIGIEQLNTNALETSMVHGET